MLKLKNIRDPKHLANIRQLPCVQCGKPESVPAHLRLGTDGGMGLKPSDCYVTPLCVVCHAIQHSVGEQTFWGDTHKVKKLAMKLFKHSSDRSKCIYFIKQFNEQIMGELA